MLYHCTDILLCIDGIQYIIHCHRVTAHLQLKLLLLLLLLIILIILIIIIIIINNNTARAKDQIPNSRLVQPIEFSL